MPTEYTCAYFYAFYSLVYLTLLTQAVLFFYTPNK